MVVWHCYRSHACGLVGGARVYGVCRSWGTQKLFKPDEELSVRHTCTHIYAHTVYRQQLEYLSNKTKEDRELFLRKQNEERELFLQVLQNGLCVCKP